MPLRNRVTPFGEIIVTPARGTLMGNRGCLLDSLGKLVRLYQGQRWIACLLEFKGHRLPLMQPGHNTQLFFLDEATALAAGHRPCMECRREDFVRFREHWAAANPELAGSAKPSVATIDAALHRERIAAGGQVTYLDQLANLPRGCLIALEHGGPAAYLVLKDRLLVWAPEGYKQTMQRPTDRVVHVLTPRSIVRALAHGYDARLHPSAD